MIAGVDFTPVNRAFSSQSSHFDDDDEGNAILQWMRTRVRQHINAYLAPASLILELNAGTGIDALDLCRNGHHVVATDLSDGMIAELGKKARNPATQGRMEVKQCSFTELEPFYGRGFDHIFSNFGGLNCVDDLRKVTRHFGELIKPGGYATLVIMQPICPWELVMAAKGNFRHAFRRLKKQHTIAHLEGHYFDTWYFRPSQVMQALGTGFRKVSLKSLATFTPPPEHREFPKRHPKVFKILNRLDEKLGGLYPFNCWGDHFIITVQYQPRHE